MKNKSLFSLLLMVVLSSCTDHQSREIDSVDVAQLYYNGGILTME